MKTILIATDFSAASRNAFLYGVELAKMLDAKIILFSAYHIPHQMPSLDVSTSEYGVMKETEERLDQEATVVKQNSTTLIEIASDHGSAETAIINMTREKNADLIIMGMKGSGKSFRKVFGSTTAELAKSTPVPVIIVPEDAKFTPPKIIAFANDISLETDNRSLSQLISIAQLFNSKVYFVRVVKNSNEERLEVLKAPPDLSMIFEILDACYEYPVDANITHGLNAFIESHKVDMLVMMPHKHEWADRLFNKSETQNMIFHTHVPLLVLPEHTKSDSSERENVLGTGILKALQSVQGIRQVDDGE